jgi:enoyl-CoA hydratase/carnithine racemase
MTQLAILDINQRIARLTINRPEARNALSTDLLAALHDATKTLAARPDVSVLVISGAGKAFCAGMDLKAVLNDPAAPGKLLHALGEFTLALRSLPMVAVAKVNGPAIGGGCGLACVADVAMTFAENKMGFPEVDLGVCPAVVAPWLVRKIGAGRARKVLLTGGLLSGAEAFQLGMVDHCVADAAELDAACEKMVARLAEGGPNALRATKGLLNELDGSMDADLIRRGAALSASVIATPETQATLRAKLGM